jgi:hypothetical protein
MKIRGNTVGTTIKPEKILVKSENLTEKEKAKARANIGAMQNGNADSDLNMNGNDIRNAVVVHSQYVSIGEPGIDGEKSGAVISGLPYDENGHAVLEFLGVENDEYTRLTGIAPGSEDNDAATVGQVKAVDLTEPKKLTQKQKAQIRKNADALGNGDEPAFGSLSISVDDEGAWISPDPHVQNGDTLAAVLNFYGVIGDEPTILRNIVCVEDGDAANKGYVDQAISTAIANLPVYNGEVEEV